MRIRLWHQRATWHRALICAMFAVAGIVASPTTVSLAASVPSLPSIPVTNTHWIPNVHRDSMLNRDFQQYGNTSGLGWAGGDSTYSVGLPNDRELWIFSDTILGPVNSVGEVESLNPIIIHNSFVVEKGNHWRTKIGGTPTSGPESLVGPSAGSPWWYWAGMGTVTPGHQLEVFYERYQQTGAGAFGFQFAGNAVAVFSLKDLTLEKVVPIYAKSPVTWGVWLMNEGRYTYIYGVQDIGSKKYLHIARVPTGHLLRTPWEFYTGASWSSRATRSAPVLAGVSNELSVVKVDGVYVLVTTDDAVSGLSPDITLSFSQSPTGPFVDPALAYKTPGTTRMIFTYNASAHPELAVGNRLVVSYNENSLSPAQVDGEISIYRPRFITIELNVKAIRAALAKNP